MLHIDAPTGVARIPMTGDRRNKQHSLLLQQPALPIRSAESETRSQRAVTKHDAMTRNHPRTGIGMQSVTNESGAMRIASERRHLTISGDLTRWNPLHHLIHGCIERFDHVPIMSRHTPIQRQRTFRSRSPRSHMTSHVTVAPNLFETD